MPEQTLAELRREIFEGTNELYNQFFASIAEQTALTAEQETTLADYLGGAIEKRDRLADFIRGLEEEAEVLRGREKRLADRRHSFETIVRMFRSSLLAQMQNHGIKRVDGLESSFRVVKNPGKVEIVNEKELPGQYINYQPQIDKRQIADDLAAGEGIPGARMADDTFRLEIK